MTPLRLSDVGSPLGGVGAKVRTFALPAERVDSLPDQQRNC